MREPGPPRRGTCGGGGLHGGGDGGSKDGVHSRGGHFVDREWPLLGQRVTHGGPAVLHQELSTLGSLGDEAQGIV